MESLLIVDSDFVWGQAVATELKVEEDLTIEVSQRGKDALDHAKTERPHWMIVNSVLSDYFGMEFLEDIERVKNTIGRPKIILIWDALMPKPPLSELENRFNVVTVLDNPVDAKKLAESFRLFRKKSVSSSGLNEGVASGKSETIPYEYIQGFSDSFFVFFEMMTEWEVKAESYFVKHSPFCQSDLSARMNLRGKLDGSVCVSFQKEVALRLVSDMVGETYDTITGDVKDGIGEVVNIVTGNAKKKFGEMGLNFTIGLPTLFTGKQLAHPNCPKVPCTVLPYHTPYGKAYLEVCATHMV